MQKHKSARAGSTDARAFVLGLCSSIALMVLMLLASVICITNEYLTLDAFKITSLFIQFICVFIGCFMAGAMAKENKQRVILLVCSVAYLLQLCSAILLFDGITSMFGGYFLISAFAGFLNLLILRRRKESKSRPSRKRR